MSGKERGAIVEEVNNGDKWWTEKPFFGRLLNSPRLSWGVGTQTGGGEMRFQHSNSSDGDDTVLFFQIYPETSTSSPSSTSLPFARAGPWGVPAPRTSSGSSRPLSRTRRRGQILPSFSSLLSPRLAEAEDMSLVLGLLGTLVRPRNSQPRILTRVYTPPCHSQTVKKKQKKSSTSSSQHLQIHRNQVGNALSFDYLKVVRFFHFSCQYDRWEIRRAVLGRFIKMNDDWRGG